MKNLLLTRENLEAFKRGDKTHARGVINPQPDIPVGADGKFSGSWKVKPSATLVWVNLPLECITSDILHHARFRKGEVTFIGEPWATEKRYNHLPPRDIPRTAEIFYVSDGVGEWPIHLPIGKLRSPHFMPAWAARTHARIIGVGCGRLWDMTEEDCIAEGIPAFTLARGVLSGNPPDPRWKFIELWDKINPKQRWASNPWTLIYGIERVEL